MAYTVTVTSAMRKRERISASLGIYCGTVDISNYSVGTPITITAITKYFATSPNAGMSGTYGILYVGVQGPTDAGYILQWSYGAGAFIAYNPGALVVDSNVAGGAALLFGSGGGAAALHATSAVGTFLGVATEAAVNTDVGEVGFVAIGFAHA